MDEFHDHDDTPLPPVRTPIAARTFYLRLFVLDAGQAEPVVRGELHRFDAGPPAGESRLGAFNSLDGLAALLRRLLLGDDHHPDRGAKP